MSTVSVLISYQKIFDKCFFKLDSSQKLPMGRRTTPHRRRPLHTSNEIADNSKMSSNPINFNDENLTNESSNLLPEESNGDISETEEQDDDQKSNETDVDNSEDVPDEDSSDSSSYIQDKVKPQLDNAQLKNNIKLKQPTPEIANIFPRYIFWISIVLAIFMLSWKVFDIVSSTLSKEMCDLESIKEKFPTQDDYFWIAFESGVHDVVQRNQPSTFILLYDEKGEVILQELVQQLSKYAICNITDCSNKPIVITDSELNSPDLLKDYGLLIQRYKEQLEKNGVMVVKNLENVRGISAQAFHSFCDQFTPLVDKSLFIFTMKVDELPGSNNMKFVEEYFKNKWTDIKTDTLNALITRITNMVLEVMT
jgi:hypothetical protein